MNPEMSSGDDATITVSGGAAPPENHYRQPEELATTQRKGHPSARSSHRHEHHHAPPSSRGSYPPYLYQQPYELQWSSHPPHYPPPSHHHRYSHYPPQTTYPYPPPSHGYYHPPPPLYHPYYPPPPPHHHHMPPALLHGGAGVAGHIHSSSKIAPLALTREVSPTITTAPAKSPTNQQQRDGADQRPVAPSAAVNMVTPGMITPGVIIPNGNDSANHHHNSSSSQDYHNDLNEEEGAALLDSVEGELALGNNQHHHCKKQMKQQQVSVTPGGGDVNAADVATASDATAVVVDTSSSCANDTTSLTLFAHHHSNRYDDTHKEEDVDPNNNKISSTPPNQTNLSDNPICPITTNVKTTTTFPTTTFPPGGQPQRKKVTLIQKEHPPKQPKQQLSWQPFKMSRVRQSILHKGLLPLDYNKHHCHHRVQSNDNSAEEVAAELSLHSNGDGLEEEVGDEGGDNCEGGGGGVEMSEVASAASTTTTTSTTTAANTSAPLIPYHNGVETGVGKTTSSSSRSVTKTASPSQMAEIKALSTQARAQIAQMKRNIKVHQQISSQRFADIAHVDVPFNERYSHDDNDEDDGMTASTSAAAATADHTNQQLLQVKKGGGGATTAAAATTQPKRYKDRDGFIYYRRVGNKHLKKLFEKGLVPKGEDGDNEESKALDRMNAIRMITTATTEEGGCGESGRVRNNDLDVPLVHNPGGKEGSGWCVAGEGVEDGSEFTSRCGIVPPPQSDIGGGEEEEEDGAEEGQESSPELPPPPCALRQTLFYSYQQKSLSNGDGYELQVIHDDDGNDFHVELVQPAASAVITEQTMQLQQHPNAEKVERVVNNAEGMDDGDDDEEVSLRSSPSMSVEKEKEDPEAVCAAQNVGEFVSAVDSILDAAETIAKRDSPRSSPVTVPQYQQDSSYDLPGVSASTKRRCTDMILGYQEEKRRRCNSIAAFSTRESYPTSSYAPPPPHVTIGQSSPESMVGGPSPQQQPHGFGPPAPLVYSQITCQDRKEKRGTRTYCYPHPSVDLTAYYSTKQVSKTEKEELTALALCAATHIQKEPVLFRAVLLNMAIERDRDSTNKKSGGAPTHLKNLALKKLWLNSNDSALGGLSSPVDIRGRKLIREGFFWNDFPYLEKVLKKYMMEYYFMSENRPQSKKQQQFNNRLVSLVYQEAISRGYVFDPITFSIEGGRSNKDSSNTSSSMECVGGNNCIIPPEFNHKKLRDRIRCYYKTHVQNSKKRLGTLLKNPLKERNRDALLRLVDELKSQEHVELSSECVVALKRLKAEQDSIIGTVSSRLAASSNKTPVASSAETYSMDYTMTTTTTTPHISSSMVAISGGEYGSSSSSSTAYSPSGQTAFSPFKHASLLSSMRQLDSQRH